MSERSGIPTAMIGVGLMLVSLLVGLRLVWSMLRHRGITMFIALVGLVAIESFARATTPDAKIPQQKPATQTEAQTEAGPDTPPLPQTLPLPQQSQPDAIVACQTLATAVEACSAAIDSGTWKDDELAWAYNNRGIAFAAKGAFLKAIADYSKAIELAPEDPAAWSNRGSAHATLGDLLAALADHERALDLAPAEPSAWHNRAVDFEELGQYRKALEDYKKSIQLDPNHLGSHVGLATANCKLGRVKASATARLALIDKGLISALEMQEILQRDGFYKGPLDGLFGKGSRAALRTWTRRGCLANA